MFGGFQQVRDVLLSSCLAGALVCAAVEPALARTTYDYDPQGRLSSVTYPDGSKIIYSRDSAGNLVGQQSTGPADAGVRADASPSGDAVGGVDGRVDGGSADGSTADGVTPVADGAAPVVDGPSNIDAAGADAVGDDRRVVDATSSPDHFAGLDSGVRSDSGQDDAKKQSKEQGGCGCGGCDTLVGRTNTWLSLVFAALVLVLLRCRSRVF